MSPTKPEPQPGAQAPAAGVPVVEVENLHVHYALRSGFLQRLIGGSSQTVKAVDGVSFQLPRGQVLGVVGESGSGKTTLGRAVLRTAAISSGRVRFEGQDITTLRESALRRIRPRMQMVFQDPNASLNPAMTLATAIGHPLRIHGVTRDERVLRRRVSESLERVGLTPVEQFLDKYPSDLSGGQKQRAVIARAIILGPSLLVADEPVSMLDMSVRAKILELMIELKNDLGLSCLYITHDLATAKFFCDTVAIMYLGRIVEYGPVQAIFTDPKHPYTRSLLHAIPEADPTRAVPRDLPRGEVPDAVEPPLGCSFHPRCPAAFELCGWESRDLRDLLERRWASLEKHFDNERSVVGDIAGLDRPALTASLRAGTGHSAGEVRALLETLRSEEPEEPFWSGVRGLAETANAVAVQFRDDCVDPPLYQAGDLRVACLLYRDNADPV